MLDLFRPNFQIMLNTWSNFPCSTLPQNLKSQFSSFVHILCVWLLSQFLTCRVMVHFNLTCMWCISAFKNCFVLNRTFRKLEKPFKVWLRVNQAPNSSVLPCSLLSRPQADSCRGAFSVCFPCSAAATPLSPGSPSPGSLSKSRQGEPLSPRAAPAPLQPLPRPGRHAAPGAPPPGGAGPGGRGGAWLGAVPASSSPPAPRSPYLRGYDVSASLP